MPGPLPSGVLYHAPDSGPSLCSLIVLPVPGLYSLDCGVGKTGKERVAVSSDTQGLAGGRGKLTGGVCS